MRSAALAAKIRIPSPPRLLVSRPRLRELLAFSLARPLTLVSAPAGFGKTSAVADFLSDPELVRAGLPSAGLPPPLALAWLSLDAEDDDPVRFWDSASAAVRRAIRRSRGLSEDDRDDDREGGFHSLQPPSAAELSFTLLQECDAGGDSIILVLDDFQAVNSPIVLDSFARFVDRSGDRLRIILLSRSDPSFPLARLRARSMLSELRAEDLRFDADEASELLALTIGGRLTGDQSRAIDEKAEGWAAGLQMAALSLSRRKDVETFIRSFSGSDRFVLEFLMEEVLSAQPEDLRSFLLASAVLDRFSAPLLEAALGVPDAASLLRSLETANLFLVPMDDEGTWFRYHHLFSDALRSRARSESSVDARSVLLRAAVWHADAGDDEGAAVLFIRAGEKGRAADALERVAHSILASGRRATLEARIAEIGESEALARRELAENAGWSRVFSGKAGETEAFLDRLASAALSVEDEKVRRDLQGALAAMRGFVCIWRGFMDEALAFADEADRLLDSDRRFSRTIVPFIRGSVARTRGEYRRAAGLFAEFERLSWDWGEIWNMMMSSYETSMTARYRGRLREAEAIYLKAVGELARRGTRSVASSCKVHGNYGELLYERGRLDEAESLLVPYLDGGDDWVLPTDILAALSPVVKVRLARGDRDGAAELVARADAIEARARTFPRLAVLFRDLRCRLSLARLAAGEPLPYGGPPFVPPLDYGEELAAVRLAERATDVRVRVGLVSLGRAGALEAAAVAVEAALIATAAREGDGMALFVEAKALEAVALRLAAAGGDAPAMDALAEALGAARGEEFVRTFVDLGSAVHPLLAALAASAGTDGGTRAYAERLLREFASGGGFPFPRSAPTCLPASPRELEVLGLLAEGLSNKEIGERLYISESTVKTHVHHLAEKLDAPNRLSIVARARTAGLIS